MKVQAYTVTLKTPEGEKKIECAEDTYILDAAEVRTHILLDGGAHFVKRRSGCAVDVGRESCCGSLSPMRQGSRQTSR